MQEVERLVNEKVLADEPVTAKIIPLNDAKKIPGVRAVFGEKYPDPVRVLSIGCHDPLGDVSGSTAIEFCGGTHLQQTSQVGLFKIISEESVAKGVRRITALTGRGAAAQVSEDERLLDDVVGKLKSNRPTVLQRIESLQTEVKGLKQELQKARSVASRSGAADIFSNVQDVGGVPLVAAEIEGGNAASLREAVDIGRKKLGSAVLVFGSREGDRVTLVVGVTKDLVEKGLHAGKMIKELAAVVGGGGGGRADMAQAGGKLAEKLPEAIAKAAEVVAAQVGV